jgi:hypothetical protein
MSKIQKYSLEEEFVDKAEADAELEIYSGVVGTMHRDTEVRLTAEAGGPLNVGSRTPIACIYNRKLQNRKLH